MEETTTNSPRCALSTFALRDGTRRPKSNFRVARLNERTTSRLENAMARSHDLWILGRTKTVYHQYPPPDFPMLSRNVSWLRHDFVFARRDVSCQRRLPSSIVPIARPTLSFHITCLWKN